MEQIILEVSQINDYIKGLLEQDAFLSSVCIRGELSNYKAYPSGHHYFTMKDSESAIRCVMFKGSAMRLRFRPENGMRVLATGRIAVFQRDGAYQLYCTGLLPEGTGDLSIAFEQLKAKLAEEGLFSPDHKKPLPAYPHRIAIITSSAGAAIHDMLRILGKRYPLSKVILLPVRVQGTEAPPEICGAIRYVNRFDLADVIITGRGGGSIEDLWAFNDERVAREIFNSRIPVVSAVGHEPDVTIADYVADVRAATPSNGAELVAPDQAELREKLQALQSRMSHCINRQLNLSRQQLENLRKKRMLQDPRNTLQDRRMLLDYQQKLLLGSMERILDSKKQRFLRQTASLDAMSPLKVLARGYSMTRDANHQIITDAVSVEKGSKIIVSFAKGELDAEVVDVRGETICNPNP